MPDYPRGTLSVFVLDDHDIVRRGLVDLLSGHRDIWVVGESASARKAAGTLPLLKPDLMVLDLYLQDGTGVEVSRAVRSAEPGIAALLLTSSGDDEALASAILAGAAGYVVKLARGDDILDAVRRAATGRTLTHPGLVEKMISRMTSVLDEADPALVPREREVATHVLAGLTNGEIAERTGGSATEVRRAVESIMLALSRAQLSPPPGPNSPDPDAR
jgi:two-component system response regulator DevR